MKNVLKRLPLLMTSALLVSACNKTININTFDLRYAYGKISLKSKNNIDNTVKLGREIIKAFEEKNSYKATLYMYYYDSNSKTKPLECATKSIVYNSGKFYFDSVQTYSLVGTLLPNPIHNKYYYDGNNLYNEKGVCSEENRCALSHLVLINQVKPSLSMHEISSADVRSGKNSKLNIVEQYVISQNQTIRFVADNNELKYYYNKMDRNTYFEAYEFIYPEDDQGFTVPTL